MGWLRRKRKPSRAGARPDAGASATPDESNPDVLEPGVLHCVACGRPLGFDPEDEPDGDGPGRHLCGECNRQRNFDADLEMRWWNGDL